MSDKSGGRIKANSSSGCIRNVVLLLLTSGVFVFLLIGFVTTKSLILLSLSGGFLFFFGLYLLVRAVRHAASSRPYLGASVTGLIMILGAMATLLPAAPANLLINTTTGWDILETRTERLEKAIYENDAGTARKLAGRGLGDSSPLDRSGRPLIQASNSIDILNALLSNGLDPDAQDLDGRTFLMNTNDPEMVSALLEAGADPNARTLAGETVLMTSTGKDPELIEMILRHGADVHAADESGLTAATLFPEEHPVREILKKYAGGRPLVESNVSSIQGREDWLVIKRDPLAVIKPSGILLDDPLQRGSITNISIFIGNNSQTHRMLTVEANLNGAVLFVDASHEGKIKNPVQPQLMQTIRWPLLSLPAHSQGRLALRVINRPEESAGDVLIDVNIREPDGKVEALQFKQTPARLQPVPASGSYYFIIPFFIVFAILAWAGFRRLFRKSKHESTLASARTISGFVALVCAGISSMLIWSILQPFVRFEDATCTILDRRYRVETSRTSSSSKGRPTVRSVPISAVRIDSNEQRIFSTGFATSMAIYSVQELRQFPLGASVPCWVDPDERSVFTLVRKPTAGVVFGAGLVMLLTLFFATIAWHFE